MSNQNSEPSAQFNLEDQQGKFNGPDAEAMVNNEGSGRFTLKTTSGSITKPIKSYTQVTTDDGTSYQEFKFVGGVDQIGVQKEELPDESLTEEELSAISDRVADTISADDVAKSLARKKGTALDMTNVESGFWAGLMASVFERPQSFFYALGTIILILAVYVSNPIVALAGGLILVVSALHYADR